MTSITLNDLISKENYKLILSALVPLKNNVFFDAYITQVYQLLEQDALIEFHNYLKNTIPQFSNNNYLIKAFENKWHSDANIDIAKLKKVINNLDDLELGVYIIHHLPIEKEKKEELFSYYLNGRSYHFNENNIKYIFEIYHQYDFSFNTNSMWDNEKVKNFLLIELSQSKKLQKDLSNIENYRKRSCIIMLCQCEDINNNIQKILDLGLFDDVKDRIYPSYMTQFNDNFAKVYNHYNISFKELMKNKTYYFTDFVEPQNFNHSFKLVDLHKNEFLDSVVRFLSDKEKIFTEKEIKDCIRHFKKDKFENLINYWNYFINLIEFDKTIPSIAQAKINLTNFLLEEYTYNKRELAHLNNILVILEKEKLEEITGNNKNINNVRLKL